MADATYTDLLEEVKNNAIKDVRVSMPARIISFDAKSKTAQVEIMLNMEDAEGNPVEYPPLIDCPCMFTRGGGFHVVHGYNQGDNGVVLFSDRCIDSWFESGAKTVPMDFRIHSMSDAYFLGAVDNLTDVSPIIDDAIFIGKDDNSAGLQINSDGSVILKGSSFEIQPLTTSNGITNTGLINTTGNVIIAGKPVDGHTHGGVQRGDSDTDAL